VNGDFPLKTLRHGAIAMGRLGIRVVAQKLLWSNDVSVFY
jgi:hypothetical protein